MVQKEVGDFLIVLEQKEVYVVSIVLVLWGGQDYIEMVGFWQGCCEDFCGWVVGVFDVCEDLIKDYCLFIVWIYYVIGQFSKEGYGLLLS